MAVDHTLSDSKMPLLEIDSQDPPRRLPAIFRLLYLIWEFTESNFYTFVIPNTSFGILGALAGSQVIVGQQPSSLEVLRRLPIVVAFNWYSVLIFDLANQRSPESVEEDLVNKPWRPIPAGKVTPEQTRRGLLVAVPIALGLNYLLGVWKEGVFIHILVWLYNDLRGGDEIVRDFIIAVAFGLFNRASLQLAIGGQASIGVDGNTWTGIISGVILTTMQVQDLKDQAGDRLRGRKSMPLFLGAGVSRTVIAFFVLFWSLACINFWGIPKWAYALPFVSGIVVVLSVLLRRTPKEDARTWKLWCLWTVILYTLPVVRRISVSSLTGDSVVGM